MGRRVVTPSDLIQPAPAKAVTAQEPESAKPAPTVDSYLSKLLKYIPTEIVGAFILADGILKSISDVSVVFYWIVFALLLVLTVVYIWRTTNVPGKPAATSQIIVSSVAFVVWVFALGGPFAQMSWYEPYFGTVVLAVYTAAIPAIVGKK